jgi:basic membrane protein A
VATITLVADVAEPAAAAPSGLAWTGVQAAGSRIGAKTALVQPTSKSDLAADLDHAAAGDLAIVVTLGPDAAASVAAAAADHAGTQFMELGVAVPAGSPPNVHGIVFDLAEAGYLAGFVAASLSGTGNVGFVGDTATDAVSASYAAGFAAGVPLAGSDAGPEIAYAGAVDSPDRGRLAAAGLIKSGVDIVSAATDLTGIGAMREACARSGRLVALETDAWQTVPDLRPCLIGSVLLRDDVAVANAIMALASGATLPAVDVQDVSTGAIMLSDFHADLPGGFASKLAGVLAGLSNNPPRTAATASEAQSSSGAVTSTESTGPSPS